MSAAVNAGAGAAIEVHQVSVEYNAVKALTDASLSLKASSVTALLGVNGAGKSTLLKAMLGLVTPTSGEVFINGSAPARARRAGQVAYVPQHEDVDWTFPVSVRDVVSMGRYAHLGITRRQRPADRQAVARAIELMDLGDLAARQVGELSGGQRKRTFVARAIAQEATIVLLDEPFAGVDERSAQTLTTQLQNLARAGHTIVVSTHDLTTLAQWSDEAVLVAGTVVMHAPVEQVLRPENLALAFGAT